MLNNVRAWLLGRNRSQKHWISMFTDILLAWISLWAAFFVRLGSSPLVNPLDYLWLFLSASVITVVVFSWFGLYKTVLRYLNMENLVSIANAVIFSSLVLAFVLYLVRSDQLIPRALIFNYALINLVLVSVVRYSGRGFLTNEALLKVVSRTSNNKGRKPALIYGAGEAGFQLFGLLEQDKEYFPVGFIDDDRQLAGRIIGGRRIYSSSSIQEIIDDTAAEDVLLAMPSISRVRRKEIIDKLEPFSLHVKVVPTLNQMAGGVLRVEDIHEVDIVDILGRDVVAPDQNLLSSCIANKAVMVTGAGGSIGSELCYQIMLQKPEVLIMFDHSEYNLYQIEERLKKLASTTLLVVVLGSVKDKKTLEQVMTQYSVDTVYHAAAYKHVPIVESNIREGFINNVYGTLNTAQVAIKTGVENFVLISTDKAVRPTSIMGATKRIAEMILQSLTQEQSVAPHHIGAQVEDGFPNNTRFAVVRFGNVLDSSGSVIPKFREQIARGGPVTVTHPKVTRYFMTIPEAAQLVIQAGSIGKGGEVFLLDMGESVRILDLAEKMIRLSGLKVKSDEKDGDIEIEFCGLRPGEKLYEELLIGESVFRTSHPMIMGAEEENITWSEIVNFLDEINQLFEINDLVQARQKVLSLAGEYDTVDKPAGAKVINFKLVN
jgi:FlaA1/EpsC-like NDP-sugar epimerase